VKDQGEDQARNGARNLARDLHPLVYHDVQIVWIDAHYFQTAPMEVWAANLSPPKRTTRSSSFLSMIQKDDKQAQKAFLANVNSKVLIPATSRNGYYKNCGLLLEELPKCRLEFEIVSPFEAIQESFFNPVMNPDPRFKVRL